MNATNDADLSQVSEQAYTRAIRFVFKFPWWLLALILLGIYVLLLIVYDEKYREIFAQLQEGILTTVSVSLFSYLFAIIVGLLIGMIRAYPPQPRRGGGLLGQVGALLHLIAYQFCTFYVSVLRGLPVLVVLLIVAFVFMPVIAEALGLRIRSSSPQSVILALTMTYSAFLSETFRAGIQSIERGQSEAARSLGMTFPQTMLFIILPQAVRRVLPPLGNDMVSMIKDSSLMTVLGVNDITQKAKLWSSATFEFFPTYLTAAAIYLTMTVLASALVSLLERRINVGTRR